MMKTKLLKMKVLLVEDDEDKRQQITEFVTRKFECNLTSVKSFQSALKAFKLEEFDLVLLDMTMPTFDIGPFESGGRTQSFGGELLLYEMERKEILSKVIVISQFDLFGEGKDEINLGDLNLRLMKQFSENYIGAVQYSISYTSWQEILENKILNSQINFTKKK